MILARPLTHASAAASKAESDRQVNTPPHRALADCQQGNCMNKKILVVDDHPMVRLAVRILLSRHGYAVFAETDNGVDALHLAQEMHPDIVILDLGIPKLDGMALIPQLHSLCPELKVLVLTANSALANRCMQMGVAGFVSKGEALDDIVRAIDSICAGYRHLPVDAFNTPPNQEAQDTDATALHSLSGRELMVLKQLAQGLSNKQIGERMQLSNKTISTYKTRIIYKLKAQHLLEIIDFAKRVGLS